MAIYQLFSEQKIPASINEVWEFISSPNNLKHITPEYIGFNITSAHLADKMYPGMMISYIVKPVLNMKMTWVTEITHVKEKEFFIDEQRVGPYKMWHHEHKVAAIDGGVLMTDLVSYIPPFSFLGQLANRIYLRRKIEQIFDYREKALIKIFGEF